MEVVPKEVAFAAAKLDAFNRNRYRIETTGATTAGPSSIVTINLPDAAVLDLRTFRVHMDVLTTAAAGATAQVRAKCPHASDLVANMEVYMGGVQIQQGIAEYNTATRMFKIPTVSFDRRHSVDALLHNGVMHTNDAVDDLSIVFQPLIGIFAESSTRYIPTSLTGPITVRLTFASTAVLVPKENAVAIGTNLTADGDRNAAANLTYTASNIYATVDTVAMGDAYEAMLMERLQTETYLPVNYKDYFSFSLTNQTGNHTLRFSLSSSSIDTCMAVMRYSNYNTAGVIGRQMTGAQFSELTTPNHFYFHSFSAGVANKKKRGNLRYHWSVNNVRHPQYEADTMNAACDLSLLTDRTTMDKMGHSVTSFEHYQNGMFVIPLILNLPGQSLNVRSGFNSRGTNTNMEFEVQGLALPAANAATQVPADLSTFVVAQTTAQIRIGGNRQIAVDH